MLPRMLLLLILLTVHQRYIFCEITEAPNIFKSVKYDPEIVDIKFISIDPREVYPKAELKDSNTIDCQYSESLILEGMKIKTINENLIQSNCIRTISLQNNYLYSVPSTIFKRVPHMSCLNMAGNSLNVHEENRMEHRYLRYLNMSYQTPKPFLPKEFETTWEDTYLNKLMVFNNKNMFFPRLEHLDLSGNDISTLMTGFNLSFPQLTHLYLMEINAVNLDFLFFDKLPASLKVLHLEKNKIEELSITNMANVSFLYLDENPLYKLYIANNKLRVLSLANCSLVNSEVTLNTQYLEELDLSTNHYHDLSDNLFQYLHSLHTLILNDNHISMIPAYQGAHGLLRLSLNYNNMSYIPPLGFQHMPILRQLSLKGNKLRHIEKNTFFDLKFLESLDLSENLLRNLPYGWSLPLRNIIYLNVNSNLFATITDVSVGTSATSLKHLYVKNNTFMVMTTAELETLPNSVSVYLI